MLAKNYLKDCQLIPQNFTLGENLFYGLDYGLRTLYYFITNLLPLIILEFAFKEKNGRSQESSQTSENKSDNASFGYFENLKFINNSFVKIKDSSNSEIDYFEDEDEISRYIKLNN